MMLHGGPFSSPADRPRAAGPAAVDRSPSRECRGRPRDTRSARWRPGRSGWTCAPQERHADQVQARVAVTPPSCTTRPLRSNTGTCQPGQLRPVIGGPDDRRDLAGAQVGPTARRAPEHRRREPLRWLIAVDPGPGRPSPSMVSTPSFRSASAHTLGSDPASRAVPSRIAAPTSRTPSALSAFRSSVARSGCRAGCIEGRLRARCSAQPPMRPTAGASGPTASAARPGRSRGLRRRHGRSGRSATSRRAAD